MNLDYAMQDCLGYANQYKCSLHDAIADLEWDGPQGSHGPTPAEKSTIAKEFIAQGFDLDSEVISNAR